MVSDHDLVAALKRGDPIAFDEVYARYHRRIHSFLLRLAGRRDVAEDLFQETWTRVAGAAARLREDTDLAAWLFTVARNAFRSHRRWSALDVSRWVALGDGVEWAAGGPPLDEQADRARTLARLETALAQLSAADREVLLLVGVEGFDQARAAAVLGISYDSLHQRLSRARARLASHLEKGGRREPE